MCVCVCVRGWKEGNLVHLREHCFDTLLRTFIARQRFTHQTIDGVHKCNHLCRQENISKRRTRKHQAHTHTHTHTHRRAVAVSALNREEEGVRVRVTVELWHEVASSRHIGTGRMIKKH